MLSLIHISPADLKKLDLKELQVVADETRQAVLNRVSKHGGHVGPKDVYKRQVPKPGIATEWPSVAHALITSPAASQQTCITPWLTPHLRRCV